MPIRLPKKNFPYLWKGIQQIWPKLLSGIRWAVENGWKVNFWNDVWLNDTPLHSVAVSELADHQLSLKVVEVTDINGRWKLVLY